MYRHKIEIELDEDVVHAYSILEWETILLAGGIIERDQIPLSFGAIAEIIAVELYKYRHFQDVTDAQWKCKESTVYVNDLGWECNTKVPKMLPDEANLATSTMVIGGSKRIKRPSKPDYVPPSERNVRQPTDAALLA